MINFKNFLRNKFTWAPDDVVHDKKKPAKEDRSDRFNWKDGEVEHHDIKEGVDEEKFHISPDTPGHHETPHQIKHGTYSTLHPHNKSDAPQPGSESHDAFQAHHDNLSSDEKHAVYLYKGSEYKTINNHLRGAKKEFDANKKKHFKKLDAANKKIKYKEDDHADLKANNKHTRRDDHDEHDHDHDDDDYREHEIDDHIHHLDNVTNHRTVEDHKVYRGGFPGDKRKYPIGHEFTDHGYTSTSFHKGIATGFAHKHPTKPDADSYHDRKNKYHVHVIHVPKGSRGHYIDVQGDNEDNHSMTEEKEMVLHRGTRFKVTHHSEDEDHHYIHSRVVKQGVRNKFHFTRKQKSKEGTPKDNHGLPGQNKFPFMKHHKRFK